MTSIEHLCGNFHLKVHKKGALDSPKLPIIYKELLCETAGLLSYFLSKVLVLLLDTLTGLETNESLD